MRKYFLGICVLFVTIEAQAGLILTFDNLPNRVRRQNPSLKAARLKIAEVTGLSKQAGLRSNPSFEASFERDRERREGVLEIGLSQKFPLTNRLELEKELSELHIEAAKIEVEEVERILIRGARLQLVKVLAIRQRRALLEEQKKVAESIASFTKDVSEVGEISLIEVGQAKLEAARFNSEIRSLSAQEAHELGELKPLLGMGLKELLYIGGDLKEAVVPKKNSRHERRPDLRLARLLVKAAEQNVSIEETKRFDDIELGAFVGIEREEDVPEGFETEGIIGIQMKIDLPFWDKNEGNIEAAHVRVQQKEIGIRVLSQKIHHEIDATLAEMEEWKKLIYEVDETLRPLAAEQFNLAEEAYRNGQTDLPSVFRAREEKLKVEASKINALEAFHKARVRYLAASNQN